MNLAAGSRFILVKLVITIKRFYGILKYFLTGNGRLIMLIVRKSGLIPCGGRRVLSEFGFEGGYAGRGRLGGGRRNRGD